MILAIERKLLFEIQCHLECNNLDRFFAEVRAP
jgi:hypothetical protein